MAVIDELSVQRASALGASAERSTEDNSLESSVREIHRHYDNKLRINPGLEL